MKIKENENCSSLQKRISPSGYKFSFREFLGDIDNDNINDKIDEVASILILLLNFKKFLNNYESESEPETDSETESISDIDSIKTDEIELLTDSDDD